MIGIAQNDLGLQGLQVGTIQGFYRGASTNRHEDRRFHRAMHRLQASATGGGNGIGLEQFKH